MAEKRQALKKVDSEKMAQGIYSALFTDGTLFEADLRNLPVTVADGKVTAVLGAAYDSLPPMVQRTLQYGIKQKLDDSMAGTETVEEAVEEIKSTWDAIAAGNWTIRVAGEGVEGGLFARAFAEFNNMSLADAKAKIGKLVEANLIANQKAVAGKKDKDGKQVEITERMVFNKLRDTAFERYPDLKAKYAELKEKRAAKAKAKPGLVSSIEFNLPEE